MTKDQLKRLQKNTSLLQELLSDLGRADELKELLRHIRQPGWTTPAEFILVSRGLEAATAQARALAASVTAIVAGARAVR